MLRYLVGTNFNAKSEIETLLIAASKKSRGDLEELCTIIDIIESLKQSRIVGFSGVKHKWSATVHDGLFLYSNLGVMGALNVPGSGRAQTFDLGLVGSALASDEPPFSAAMSSRRRNGNYHVWN
jgi:hypothetical protein